jgi:hypothetical protein
MYFDTFVNLKEKTDSGNCVFDPKRINWNVTYFDLGLQERSPTIVFLFPPIIGTIDRTH